MSTDQRPLFEAYPGLRQKVPWLPLATLPTPVQRLTGLGEAVGIPSLYGKRDDLTSPLYGGNKLRKLEFLLADARRLHARTVLTLGAAGSNHALATAIYSHKLGLRTVLILVDQPVAQYVRDNLLLDHHFQAKLCSTSLATLPLRVLYHRLAGCNWKRLRPSYFITFGGSSPLGCLGYVNAAFELGRQVEEGQMPEPDYVYVAVGSAGTASGLLLGLRLVGLKSRVIGVQVAPRLMCSPRRWSKLVNRISRFMTAKDPAVPSIRVAEQELTLLEGYVGHRYAQFTDEGMKAIQLMAECEGIRLEGTYTGKALAGALDYVKKNQLEKHIHLFWNTYNSADLSTLIQGQDYRALPKAFHRYFELPLQELDAS